MRLERGVIGLVFGVACMPVGVVGPSEAIDAEVPDGRQLGRDAGPEEDGGPRDRGASDVAPMDRGLNPEDAGHLEPDIGTPGSDGGGQADATVIVSGTLGPQLLFTDLVSGPRSGNSDPTLGPGGAIVTVWGRGLGASQGASRLRIGGVEAPIHQWANATTPADLYSRHGLQMVAFLIPEGVAVGPQTIEATVDGQVTNTLPFTVRDQGAIHFVAPNGNDNNAGTYAAPWATMGHAVDEMSPGDLTYALDGVVADTTHQFHGCINLANDGTAQRPQALLAYPGAQVDIGGNCDSPFGNFNGGTNAAARHWVVSKMRLLGGGQAAIPGHEGYRIVGNYVAMTNPEDNCQSGAIYATGNDVYILGNQVTQTARDNPSVSKLCHTIYVTGRREGCGGRCPTESNREIGWNLLDDNYDNRGINIYSEQGEAAFIEGHRVHDNYLINHRGDGILIGYYVTGENWFYNNVLINTGLGPEWGGEISGHYAFQINGGHESDRPTTLHIWNNTILGGGYPDNDDSAAIAWGPRGAVTLDLKNNIVVINDVPYLSPSSSPLPGTTGPNLWFGRGPAPAQDQGALNADPLFVDPNAGDLHLSAGSPALDRGTPTSAAVDFDGNPRPAGPAFDLGAYERP